MSKMKIRAVDLDDPLSVEGTAYRRELDELGDALVEVLHRSWEYDLDPDVFERLITNFHLVGGMKESEFDRMIGFLNDCGVELSLAN